MAGDIGRGQCRDDDEAPAVGVGAPLGGPHRLGDVPRLVENCPAGVLGSRAYAAPACGSRLRQVARPATTGTRKLTRLLPVCRWPPCEGE
jgi:hypothetical protein